MPPIDKSSTILTMFLAALILGEGLGGIENPVHGPDWDRHPDDDSEAEPRSGKTGSRRWLGAALLSAAFASLTAILGKIGIQGVESNLGTAIRTCVVLAMAWLPGIPSGKAEASG